MGARIYDPALGRFLSPDPAGASTPYVYVHDNPMSDTDPSGAMSLGQIVTIAALVVLSVVTYGALSEVLAAYLAGMATGAIMGFTAGMIASDGNLHAGLMGALAGAASGAVFGYLGGLNYSGGMWEKAAVEGFAGGALSDVEGGSFRDGFIGAFVGSMSEGLTRRIPGSDDLANTEKVAAAAALGGTTSELTGGSFANGAISAAFQHLFNSVEDESQRKNAQEKKEAAKDKIPNKLVVLKDRTQISSGNRIYTYQLQNKEGTPLTGNGYSAEEHIVTISTDNAKAVQREGFFQIHNGEIVDEIGRSTLPPTTTNADIRVRQTWTIKYHGHSYALGTVFAHHVKIYHGFTVYATTTVLHE